METLLTIFILVLIFLFAFSCVLGLYAVFCKIEQRHSYNKFRAILKKDLLESAIKRKITRVEYDGLLAEIERTIK